MKVVDFFGGLNPEGQDHQHDFPAGRNSRSGEVVLSFAGLDYPMGFIWFWGWFLAVYGMWFVGVIVTIALQTRAREDS